jgi:tetratricopeptide (TPR) repeat protein
MNNLSITIDNKDVVFVFPEALSDNSEIFYKGVELMDSNPITAENFFRDLIQRHPNAHIDAYIQLAHLYYDRNKFIEGDSFATRAYYIGEAVLEENVKNNDYQIEWGVIENRPFLRACVMMGEMQNRYGNYENALQYFEFIIKKNPRDNQGVRFLLIFNYLNIKAFDKVISLQEEYDDEGYEWDCAIGLAYFLSGSTELAIHTFTKVKSTSPHIFNEIRKSKHIKPQEGYGYGGGILTGSPLEAYLYWKKYQDFYKNKNLLKILKSI